MAEEELFWADQLAHEIRSRKRFRYEDKEIKRPKEFVVKTSASLSGVLHIGRLSDTIRGSSVKEALDGIGAKSRLIWVGEDMDPLRKVPTGVPKDFSKYLGMPVTDVPDPKGCHNSYADHFASEYMDIIDEFVPERLEKFSMREEYKKGHFKEYIRAILKDIHTVKQIQQKYRTNDLPDHWSPWQPICANCSKIVTPKVLRFENDVIEYKCQDYSFESTHAAGCNHKSTADPLKDQGKLVWKSEWAAQWARWQVSSEGAGKEYQVPNSAFWVNAEICERVLRFPSPVPIFYEHLMVDGVKMSASLGNVIYPRDWTEVAYPEMLRFYYNKRLMKTRSFSWGDLPSMYEEYDNAALVYFGIKKIENKKEESQIRRLYQASKLGKERKPLLMSFSHALVICQIFDHEKDIIASLEKTGHYQKEYRQETMERIERARAYIAKYAPDDMKFQIQAKPGEGLNDAQKESLSKVADILKREWDEKTLFEEFYRILNELGMKPGEFFQGAYRALFNKDRGPKLAPFILMYGKEKVAEILRKV